MLETDAVSGYQSAVQEQTQTLRIRILACVAGQAQGSRILVALLVGQVSDLSMNNRGRTFGPAG
jgi:hypothetical protein